MKNKYQSASELMFQNQICATDERKPQMVLPSDGVRKFLLDAINQLNFPGQIVEFVVDVKRQIAARLLINKYVFTIRVKTKP